MSIRFKYSTILYCVPLCRRLRSRFGVKYKKMYLKINTKSSNTKKLQYNIDVCTEDNAYLHSLKHITLLSYVTLYYKLQNIKLIDDNNI